MRLSSVQPACSVPNDQHMASSDHFIVCWHTCVLVSHCNSSSADTDCTQGPASSLRSQPQTSRGVSRGVCRLARDGVWLGRKLPMFIVLCVQPAMPQAHQATLGAVKRAAELQHLLRVKKLCAAAGCMVRAATGGTL